MPLWAGVPQALKVLQGILCRACTHVQLKLEQIQQHLVRIVRCLDVIRQEIRRSLCRRGSFAGPARMCKNELAQSNIQVALEKDRQECCRVVPLRAGVAQALKVLQGTLCWACTQTYHSFEHSSSKRSHALPLGHTSSS